MPYNKFLIAPFEIGQENDIEPWLLPEKAFAEMENVYLYRGRVVRKPGFRHLDRLRIALTGQAIGPSAIPTGNIDVLGVLGLTGQILPGTSTFTHANVVPGTFTDLNSDGNILLGTNITNITQAANAVVTTVAGHTIIIGDTVYISGVTGMTEINGGPYNVINVAVNDITLNVDSSGFGAYIGAGVIHRSNVGTLNYSTNILNINLPPVGAGALTAAFAYAKCLPVMGCCQRQIPAINAEETICFDTENAYLYNTATSVFNDITPAPGWTGSNSQFFWTTNYWEDAAGNNLLWVTNNNAADFIRYYNGTAWTTITPRLNAGATRLLWTSLIIVPYRNRLVCLNTTERDTIAATTTNYKNRARWCQNGTPLITVDVTAWQDDVIGKGGYIDAPTNEMIRTAQFIKDTLIVGFERSTWALKYTGNEILPFIWERVDSELGCESPWSSIVFDDAMIQVGYRGINAANASGASRIDLKVPDLVQQIHNENNGQSRVHGIRDFNTQMVYWTYSDAANDGTFPDKMIAYNYYNQAFSIFDNHFTAVGYYEPFNDLRWVDLPDVSWEEALFAWNSGRTQSGYPSIIAGNQVGFVSQLMDITPNAVTLYITNATQALPCVLTVPNHNLQTGQCIQISDVIGMTELNDNYYFVVRVNANSFSLQELDANGNRANVDSTTYTAYGSYGLVKLIDNFSLITKRLNPFANTDNKIRIKKIKNLMATTTNGEILVNTYMDQNSTTPVAVYDVSTAQSITPPLTTKKDWFEVYVNSVGNFLQLQYTMNDSQLITDGQNTANFELHGIIFDCAPSGELGSWT